MSTTNLAEGLVPEAADSMRRVERPDLIVILLLLVLGIFQIATVQRIESPGSDSSVYMMLAHNIRETGRYEFNYQMHTVYPPGFPLLLAGISTLTGREGYNIFIRFMPGFGTLAFIVWYFVLRRDEGRVAAGACCVLAATSAPHFQMVTRSVLSDAPFFLASGLVLWCLMGFEGRDKHPYPVRYLRLLAFCLATGLTVLLRSAGVALSAASIAWVITRRWYRDPGRSDPRRVAVLAAIVGLAAFFCWLGWTKHAETRDYPGQQMGSYASQFMARDPHRPELGTASAGTFVLRAAANIPVRASHIAALAIRARYVMPTWYSPVTVMVLALLACGLTSCLLASRRSLLAWYFLAYFSIYLLWPFDEGPRFMLPVAPLAFILIWRGMLVSAHLLRTRTGATLGTISALAAGLAVVTGIADRVPGLQAQAAAVFWPFFAVGSGMLLVMARRCGDGKTGTGLASAIAFLYSRRAQYGIVAAVAVLVGIGVFQQAVLAQVNVAPDPSSFRHHSSADFASWLRSAEDGAVMAEQSAIVHRLSGRRVASFPISPDPKVIVTTVRREMVRYIMVSDPVKFEYFFPTEEERWRQVESAYPFAFHLVRRGPGYRVFELEQQVGR